MDEIEDLRAWGVPERLLPYTGWDPDAWDPGDVIPVLFLPDDWSVHSSITIDDLQTAAHAGIGVALNSGEEAFDLEWFGDSLADLRLLWLARDPRRVANVAALSRMSRLVSLRAWSIQQPIDLSHLEHLRVVQFDGVGTLSALAAPSLKLAVVTVAKADAELSWSPSLEWIDLTTQHADLEHLSQVLPSLRALGLHGTRTLDLRYISGFQGLEQVKINVCKTLTGIEHLRSAKRLRSLYLDRVRSIENSSALLDLDLEEVHAEQCPDLDAEFALAAREHNERWVILPGRVPGRGSLFALTKATDGTYEVSFDDWDWLNQALSGDTGSQRTSSYELSLALEAVANDSSETESIRYQNDSEGDAFRAVFRSRVDATRTRRVWDRYLSRLAK